MTSAPGELTRRVLVGAERGAVTGHDHRGEGKQEFPAGVQRASVGAERIVGGPVRAPPHMSARNDVARRGHDRGNVLSGVPRRAQQPDRRPEFGPVRVAVEPAVPQVHGPVVVDPRRREQRGVDRVIGMMMAEHHVGHVPGLRAVLGQGGQQGLAGGHHAGIDDDHRVAVQDQRDRPGHSLVVAVPPHVPFVQHVYRRGPARPDLHISHERDTTLLHPVTGLRCFPVKTAKGREARSRPFGRLVEGMGA